MRLASVSIAAALFALLGCGGAANNAECLGGDTYPDEGFATNAAAELSLRAQLKALNDRMKAAEADLLVKPTAAELQALYEAGSPSLSSVAAPSFSATMPALFTAFEAAAGNTWTPAEPPVGAGGQFGTWIFSERGVDLRQAEEKGFFGAGHYAEAVQLMKGDVTPATVDRILALYGANPSFPMDDKAMVNPDVHSAVYAKRRTNPAAATPGPYLAIKRAFIDARAAAAKGTACAATRDQAFATIRAEWERALIGTVVFYLNDAAAKLERNNATAAEKASAQHGYGEGVAFLQGLRAVPPDARVITDAEIDDVLSTVLSPWAQPATAYKLQTDPISSVPHLATGIGKIQSAWNFTSDEVANFKVNF
ncbi:MAG: hypothetical protein AB1938_02340 [Myxococcota bacterium]